MNEFFPLFVNQIIHGFLIGLNLHNVSLLNDLDDLPVERYDAVHTFVSSFFPMYINHTTPPYIFYFIFFLTNKLSNVCVPL